MSAGIERSAMTNVHAYGCTHSSNRSNKSAIRDKPEYSTVWQRQHMSCVGAHTHTHTSYAYFVYSNARVSADPTTNKRFCRPLEDDNHLRAQLHVTTDCNLTRWLCRNNPIQKTTLACKLTDIGLQNSLFTNMQIVGCTTAWYYIIESTQAISKLQSISSLLADSIPKPSSSMLFACT
jgi:hypothetical protein